MALYPLLRPFAFALDAERAHRATIRALKLLPAGLPAERDPMLAVCVAGIDFPNPVGLAAGFDKDAEVWRQMLGFGFGFVEVGTVTPEPQAGNEKRRLFRLTEDRAVINRMGFNNAGLAAARAKLTAGQAALAQLRFKLSARRPGIVGVNIGANKDSADRIADYVTGVREMCRFARYLAVNISSPNTPGLRALQDKGALGALLDAVMEARESEMPLPDEEEPRLFRPPIFLKVAPDLERSEIDAIAKTALDRRVDALIVGNTTVSRPALKSRHRAEAGGLSGAPLKRLALQRLRDFRSGDGRRAAADRGGRDREWRRRLRPDQGRGEPGPALHGARLSRAGDCEGDQRRAEAAARAGRLRQYYRGNWQRSLGRRLKPEHALAPPVGAAVETAVPPEHAVQPRILPLPGPNLDAECTQRLDHARREFVGLAVIHRAAGDQVRQVDRLLDAEVPVERPDQGLADISEDRASARRADRADEAPVAQQDRGQHRRARALARRDRVARRRARGSRNRSSGC